MDTKTYFDLEMQLLNDQQARLSAPDRQVYSGPVQLGDDLRGVLLEHEHSRDFVRYGLALFRATYPVGGELHRGLYSALDSSRRLGMALRLRLNLAPEVPAWLHGLHWELLTDAGDFEVGRSPETVFSRYVSRPYRVGRPQSQPRMLVVIAAPRDCHRYDLAPISFEYTRRRLEGSFEGIRRHLAVQFMERPVTPERLRDTLQNGRFDLLHIHGHGVLSRGGSAALVLEDEENGTCFVDEGAIRNVLLGLGDLKLVTLVACHGGEVSDPEEHLSGLAGSLVDQNVPAVIAMRRAITMKLGFSFTRHFYHYLAKDPCVDGAVNEARHRLHMEDPEGVDWSSPMLFMRLADGILWQRVEPGVSETETPPPRRRWPAPAAVSLVVSSAVVGFLWFGPYGAEQVRAPEPAPDGEMAQPGPGPSDEEKQGTSKHDEPVAQTVDPLSISQDRGSGAPAPGEATTRAAPQTPPSDQTTLPRESEPKETGMVAGRGMPLLPVEPGRVWVAAVAKDGASWDGSAASIFLRQLRSQSPGLEAAVLPSDLRANVGALLDGGEGMFPGGDESPGGVEFVVLVRQHTSTLPRLGSTHAVRVACEVKVLAATGPTVIFDQLVDHTGHGASPEVASEQAVGRCVAQSKDALS